MIYSGEPVDAQEALRIGLISRICPAGETYETALEMAETYAAGPAALQFAKQALRAGTELPLAQAIAREAEYVSRVTATEDAAIGLSNFGGKDPRRTVFTGR